MTPETGSLHAATIREEAAVIVDRILDRQTQIDRVVTELQEREFSSLRAELGYEQPEEADRTELTDKRVKSMRNAVTVDALKQVLVPSRNSVNTVVQSRNAVENILAGRDDRLTVITGPCSIHDPEEALKYADCIVGMREQYGDQLEIIMRAYLEKPRTGPDWKGLINDPELNGRPNISLGLTMSRLLLCQITDKGVPVALERVDARTTQYFDDLSTYDAIGARDIQSTRARNYLSVTSAVGGAKNPTDGDLLVPVQAVLTAHAEHTYLGDGAHSILAEIESTGNETVHVILRGGADGPNYSSSHVQLVKEYQRRYGLPEVVFIDASHGNSMKVAANQAKVVADISQQLIEGERAIRGVMIESNLRAGTQAQAHKAGLPLEYGISITDECIDLEKTEMLFQMLAGGLMGRRAASRN